MTTDRHTNDMLATLEQAESAGRAEAAQRYWYATGQLADEETGAQFSATPFARVRARRARIRAEPREDPPEGGG